MKTRDGNGHLNNRLMILLVVVFCGVLFLMASCTGGTSPPVQELTTEEATVQPATSTPALTATPTVMPCKTLSLNQ